MGTLSIFVHLISLALVQGFIVTSTTKRSESSTFYSQGKSLVLPLPATSTSDQCDVAIFGGGFGGLYTALAIAREARMKGKSFDVAIVDPSTQFVFLPLLYDLTVGTATSAEVCPKYQDILRGTGVRHIQAAFDEFSSPSFHSAQIHLHGTNSTKELSFRTSVVAVGATPESSLASVPGAADYVQPFYTQENAEQTGKLLQELEYLIEKGSVPRIAIIGGGYGGVELAACVKRRLSKSQVTLLTRGPPMKGTRAEELVDKALKKIGVEVELSSVQEIMQSEVSSDAEPHNRVIVKRQSQRQNNGDEIDDKEPWDAVLWTAGSGPACPVSGEMVGLSKVESGRLAVDGTLRCIPNESVDSKQPPVWALGDCTEIVGEYSFPAAPKTAQAAMQQADVVAHNVLAELQSKSTTKKFQFQDLGTMLTLGGPNGAIMAPMDDSPLAPFFKPLLDTARVGLGIADEALVQLSKSSVAETVGIAPVVENLESLGLSLGGYGLGVDSDTSAGTLAGTLSGAARRAVYAFRMPTNRQRVTAAASAAISTAAALAKEASEQMEKYEKNKR
jgi:NADH dehydrogenase FAD-containing subunit